MKQLLAKPYGLLLVTGPTGSGKTTTLYSALSELNKSTENISTAEDPVEFNLMGINQVQMHEDIGLNLLSYKETGQDGFFMLLVAPSVEVDEVIAKDVILVMDSSGSMEGEKMAHAQEAARYVVDHLNPEDRFNIVSFSTGVRNFQRELMPATNPGNYDQFINSFELSQ